MKMPASLIYGVFLILALPAATLSCQSVAGPGGEQPQARDSVAMNQATPSGSSDACNVLDFGAAGDGETDNTAAFQAALDAAGASGGGIVHVPVGRYLFRGSLKLPPATSLEGEWLYVPSHQGWDGVSKPTRNTILMPIAGAGSENGDPFIQVNDNGALRGVSIFYPEQTRTNVPTPYPFAIAMRGNNPAVLDVELVNPYQGIDARFNKRSLVRNVHGQPLRMGILVDRIFDIGRIENVHWNPYWSHEPALLQWQLHNGEGFVFYRTDWHYVLNTFCFGYRYGYRFGKSERGLCNGNFLGIGADRCLVAVQADAVSPIGVLITNGEFVSFDDPDPTMIVVSPENEGVLSFVNCAFWGPNNQIAKIAGKGTVGFNSCIFREYDRKQEGRYAIQAEGGDLLVQGCTFAQNAPQVDLAPRVRRAVITGNLMEGAVRIRAAEGVQTHVAGNLATRDK